MITKIILQKVASIEKWQDYIKKETLGLSLKFEMGKFDVEKEMEMEEGKVKVSIKK